MFFLLEKKSSFKQIWDYCHGDTLVAKVILGTPDRQTKLTCYKLKQFTWLKLWYSPCKYSWCDFGEYRDVS